MHRKPTTSTHCTAQQHNQHNIATADLCVDQPQGIVWKAFVIFNKQAAPAAEAAKQQATKKAAPASGKAKKGSKGGDSGAAGTPAKKDK